MEPKGIIRFSVRNFRGIVELTAAPNGRNVTLRGKNAAGKSAAVDALWWGLGGSLDGEVVRNGADAVETEILFDGYKVRRRQVKGKRPTLSVKTADDKATINSPTTALSGFIGAIERRTFTGRPAREQAEILRRLSPGLDVSDLEKARAAEYEARTRIGQERDLYDAQARGVELPAAPAEIGEEKSPADLSARHRAALDARGANDRVRQEHVTATHRLDEAQGQEERARLAIEDARRALVAAEQAHVAAQARTAKANEAEAAARGRVDALRDPDLGAIETEMRGLEEHNKAVRQRQAQVAARQRAEQERARLAKLAEEKRAAYKARTDAIAKLDEEKLARIAGAKVPIPGLALAGDVVTYDDGTHGPVEARMGVLNDAACGRLDVAIGAALGYRLIALRNAERFDKATRAEIDRMAAAAGVQLFAEVVSDDGALEAVIEDGAIGAGVEQLDLADDFT